MTTITLYVPGMAFDGESLAQGKSLGGSETAGWAVARELARRGHRVTLFCRCGEERQGAYEGVHYQDIGPQNERTPFGGHFEWYAQNVPHDVLIGQRAPGLFARVRAARLGLWWIHDLAVRRHLGHLNQAAWNIDGLLCVSEFHKAQAADVYGWDPQRIHVLRNGVDASTFGPPADPERKRRSKTMLYSSRPERGLAALVAPDGVMPRLAEADPELQLLVAGYDHVTADTEAMYQALWRRCRELPNVTLLGSLSQTQLHHVMQGAWLHCYPTDFEETSCITAMEAQIAGTPVLTRAVGGLPETLQDGGAVWIAGERVDAGKAAEAILALRDDPEHWQRLHEAALSVAPRFDWVGSVDELERVIQQAFHERKGTIARANVGMARHCLMHGDVVALKHWLAQLRMADPEALLSRAQRDELRLYDFVDTGRFAGHYAAFYESEQVKGVQYGPQSMDGDPRYDATVRWLLQQPPEAHVLDWGCAHGPQTNNLAKRFPEMTFVGVDIAPDNVRIAREWAEAEGIANVRFLTTTEVEGGELVPGTFEVLLAEEVLEHVPDAGAFMDELTAFLAPTGKVFFSVPYGPHEYMSRVQTAHDWRWRGHIQHLEEADLRDLFGHHANFGLHAVPYTHWRDFPLGWWIGNFDAPAQPSGRVDYTRKWRTTAPRELLSVCMIATPDGATLAATLASVHEVAEEILIGIDAGDNPAEPPAGRAWDIAAEYGATAFAIESPLRTGFDAARNTVIDRAAHDWVLWIDDDERLMHPERLHKYLRPNHYDSYAVPQHHFAVEPAGKLKTDYPCRLFRTGRGFRFYGVVHEHPERGELNSGPGRTLVLPDVAVAHQGYATEDGRRQRFWRNWPLMQRDREQYPERRLGRFLWIRDMAHINRFEISRYGRPTAACATRAQEAIAMWRALLEERQTRLAVDSLEYLGELADLATNGQAVEVELNLGVNRFGLGDHLNGTGAPRLFRGRLPSTEDARALITVLAEERLEAVEGQYL